MAGVTHAAFYWLNTQEGDFPMMFRKWMIGTCIAVAAMAVSAAAHADEMGYRFVGIVVKNESTRGVVAENCTSVAGCAPMTTTIAPLSSDSYCYMVSSSDAEVELEDVILTIKVRNRPIQKFKIRADEVARLMRRGNFTAADRVHPAVDVRVDKKGFVKFSKPYLRSDASCSM